MSGSQLVVCTICSESKQGRGIDFPRVSDLPRRCAEHARNVCRACHNAWWLSELETRKELEGMPCATCRHPWHAPRVEQLMDDTVAARIAAIRARAARQRDPNYRDCVNGACKAGQIHRGGAASPLMACTECGTKACFVHKRPWHEGQTCAEFDQDQVGEAVAGASAGEKTSKKRRRVEEEKTSKKLKVCPTCNVDIVKTSGCDYMTCTACYTSFCFECRVDYRNINHYGGGHSKDCSNHPDNVNRRMQALRDETLWPGFDLDNDDEADAAAANAMPTIWDTGMRERLQAPFTRIAQANPAAAYDVLAAIDARIQRLTQRALPALSDLSPPAAMLPPPLPMPPLPSAAQLHQEWHPQQQLPHPPPQPPRGIVNAAPVPAYPLPPLPAFVDDAFGFGPFPMTYGSARHRPVLDESPTPSSRRGARSL